MTFVLFSTILHVFLSRQLRGKIRKKYLLPKNSKKRLKIFIENSENISGAWASSIFEERLHLFIYFFTYYAEKIPLFSTFCPPTFELGLIPGYGNKFYFHILKENKTITSMNTRLHGLKQQSNFKSACVKNKRGYQESIPSPPFGRLT